MNLQFITSLLQFGLVLPPKDHVFGPSSPHPRITAYGAAGGRSVLVTSRSHGVYLTGDFWLKKGEDLYILVGQQGEDACPSVSLILVFFDTVTHDLLVTAVISG